jgi:hypothetical protein
VIDQDSVLKRYKREYIGSCGSWMGRRAEETEKVSERKEEKQRIERMKKGKSARDKEV